MPAACLPPLRVFSECLSQRKHVLTVQVDNGYVGAGDDASLAHNKPQTSSPASHNSNATLKCEGGQCSLEMKATATLNRHGRWVLRLFRVFNADGIVGTTESSLVGLFILESSFCSARNASSFGGARGALVLLVKLGGTGNWADGVYWFGEG